MKLRDALKPLPDVQDDVELATIVALNADGTVGVDFGGRTADPVPALDNGWTPAQGMAVACVRMGGSWLVLGPTRSANAATVPVSVSLAFPFDVLPTATVSASPLVVSAVSIKSWRDNEAWSGAAESNRAAQGAYTTRFGFYRGCYFYGSGAFASLEGQTATSLTIRISRRSVGGISGAEYVYLAPHTHPTQPGGRPYFPVAAQKYLGPAWGGVSTITLPTEWGQGLIDGTYAGIGHLYAGTADYAVYNGLADDSLSGRLTLGFS